MADLQIRVACPADAAALREIYAPYVLHTAVTFEYEVPTREEFARRIAGVLEKRPYLVALRQEEIVGYAYAGVYIARPASDWAAETTVYIRQDQKRTGVGRALYRALEGIAALQNIQNLNAAIAYPVQEDEYLTRASAEFHARQGYSKVGVFHRAGYKFDRWYDLLWMEKMIGPHSVPQPALIPFPALPAEKLRALGIEK